MDPIELEDPDPYVRLAAVRELHSNSLLRRFATEDKDLAA